MITAGKLNRRVTIEAPSATVDAYGQKTKSWETVAEVSASIRPISGKEKLRAMVYDTVLTDEITIRYQPKLLPTVSADAWRIRYKDRKFLVTSALDWMDARQFIVFEVREIGND